MIKTIEIEILKTHSCPWCPVATKLVKKIAKNFRNVKITETYLETPEGYAKAMKLGVQNVPTVLLNGNIFSIGVPNEEELKKALERAERK